MGEPRKDEVTGQRASLAYRQMPTARDTEWRGTRSPVDGLPRGEGPPQPPQEGLRPMYAKGVFGPRLASVQKALDSEDVTHGHV